MNRCVARLPLLLALALQTACAFTQADLDVRLDPATARRGPLSEARALQLEFADFSDTRIDRERIGYKKNGFGQNTADIQTLKPVTEVVREAVQATFEANGHAVAKGGALRVDGEVTQFWFDTQMNFWTMEFMGTVGCKLKVTNAASGALIHEGEYLGHYNEKSAGGYEKSWQRVMNLAVARLAETIALDSKLSDALKETDGAPAGPP
jgi:uncharacterized lipoprotein YajG